MKSIVRKSKFFFLIILATLAFASCKKCVTCVARDASTSSVKFEETSCANGPLQDDWEKDILLAYPSPQYNTTCK